MDLKPLILLACSARNRGPYGPPYANNVSMASLQDELPSRSPNFQQQFVTTANTTTVRTARGADKQLHSAL
jgi:hypothetical protein